MSAKPTVEALKMATCFAANIKGATPFYVIGVAGAFDAYLAGEIEVFPIKVKPDDFQVVVQLKSGGVPEEPAQRSAS